MRGCPDYVTARPSAAPGMPRTLALAAAIVFAGTHGCAMTESVARVRSVTSRAPFRRQGTPRLTVSVATEPSAARLNVAASREAICVGGILETGVETRTTSRRVSGGASWFANTAALIGGSAALGGLWAVAFPRSFLCPPAPQGSTAAPPCPTNFDGTVGNSGWTASGARALGGAVAIVGVAAIIPWLVNGGRESYTSDTTPFSQERDATTAPCGEPEPLANVEVKLAPPPGAGGAQLRAGVLDSRGRLSIELGDLLPSDAFGAHPWEYVTVVLDGRVTEQASLAGVAPRVRDARYAEAVRDGSTSAFERFVASFPGDDRAAALRGRVDAIQAREAAERAAETARVQRAMHRAAEWEALGNDEWRLLAFAAGGVGDAYEAEVQCRMAMHGRGNSAEQMHADIGRCTELLASLPDVEQRERASIVARARREEALAVAAERERRAQQESEEAVQAFQAEQARQRAEAWTAAGNGDAALDAFVALGVHDAYDAEVRCRLALRVAPLEAMRTALGQCQASLAALPEDEQRVRPSLVARARQEQARAQAALDAVEARERARDEALRRNILVLPAASPLALAAPVEPSAPPLVSVNSRPVEILRWIRAQCSTPDGRDDARSRGDSQELMAAWRRFQPAVRARLVREFVQRCSDHPTGAGVVSGATVSRRVQAPPQRPPAAATANAASAGPTVPEAPRSASAESTDAALDRASDLYQACAEQPEGPEQQRLGQEGLDIFQGASEEVRRSARADVLRARLRRCVDTPR